MLSARDAALAEILAARLGLGLVQQAIVVLLLGPGHGLVERPLVDLAPARLAALAAAAAVGLQARCRPVGQHGQGLGEVDAFHLHDEAEDVAADVADPALERLPLGIDLQAGARVVVPGAKADVVAALAAELDDAADQIDDVDRLADLFLGVQRRSG